MLLLSLIIFLSVGFWFAVLYLYLPNILKKHWQHRFDYWYNHYKNPKLEDIQATKRGDIWALGRRLKNTKYKTSISLLDYLIHLNTKVAEYFARQEHRKLQHEELKQVTENEQKS